MIEIIKKLDKSGEFMQLVKGGLMSSKAITFFEVCIEVDKMNKTTSKKRMQIYSEVAEKFRISESSVRRILRIMQYENRNSYTDARRQTCVS